MPEGRRLGLKGGGPKLKALEDYLRQLGSVLVAFSGGVDSGLLALVAARVLGDAVLAVTVDSPLFPRREMEEARALASRLGLRHLSLWQELVNEDVLKNPPDRCYYCRREAFQRLWATAREFGLKQVIEGANADDALDFRPGARAAKEMAVNSPLQELGFTKQEIRALGREMGLPVWNKPSAACLASRLPYGDRLTVSKLTMVERAETALSRLGLSQVRVRHHGPLARVEVQTSEIPLVVERREEIIRQLKEVGYTYVCVDLEGYRTGSLNKLLRWAKHDGR